jgi:pimeloyl-ACP methyl ester carboxylesterase
MNSFPQNSTVVLVHGAWADGSCWRELILPLEGQGLRVICASLPLTSLTDDVLALTRWLERTNGPVVLAGHAYGGAVIGGIHEERVKSFVYVAAFARDEGETVAQVFYRAEPHSESPKLAPDRLGFIWLPEDGFGRAVAHRASNDQIRLMAAVQRPISAKCIQEGAPAPGWRAKPSWFLLAEEDRMIHPQTQQFMARRMGAKVRSIRADHSPMYTAGEQVAEVILEAARESLLR